MRLSAHFTVEEFRCRDGTPAPASCWGMLSHLCTDYLEPLRRAHGPVEIISGYRTRSWNKRVGGAPRSFHVYVPERQGVAADVVAARGEPDDWWRTLLKLRPGGLGKYPGHTHVDNRAGLARW